MTLMAADHSSNADDSARRFSVKARLTPKRPRRQIENDEYGAFARRVPRAYRRVGARDRQVGVMGSDGVVCAVVPGLTWG